MQGLIGTEAQRAAEDAAVETASPSLSALGRSLNALRKLLVLAFLVVSDALLVLAACGAVATVGGLLGGTAFSFHPSSVAAGVLVWVGLRGLLGLYPGYGLDPVDELRRQSYASMAAVAATGLYLFASHDAGLGALFVVLAPILCGILVGAPVFRYLMKRLLRRLGVWGRPVVVLGDGGAGRRVFEALGREWQLGLRPVGLFAYGEDDVYGEALEDAMSWASRLCVETAVFALPDAGRERLAGLVDAASVGFRNVMVIPNVIGVTNSVAVARDLAGTLGVEFRHNLLDPWARRLKRALDLFGVIAGGLAISPILLTLALMVRLDSPGPVFYGHRRLGAGNEHFRCWKFRTMHADADALLEGHLRANPEARAEWEDAFKLRDDPRVTRVGRLLRKTSLDELPQLFNVLRGEMSLVGPRPIVDDEVVRYGTVYNLYKRIKPGMSGFWQVGGRSDTGYGERVEMDAYYVRNWSVWLDLVVLARTVGCVLLRRGAY